MITAILHSTYQSNPFTRLIKMLTAVLTTGAGEAVDFECILSQFTMVVSWGGTVPTNVVVALEGSIDNSKWVALTTQTVTASPTMVHVVNKPVRYIRANYVSKTGGDATTSVTVECVAGGN